MQSDVSVADDRRAGPIVRTVPARARVDRLVPPLQVGGVAVAVTRRLTEAIHLGLLEPGQQLPSESTLAGQLGVSIVTLRDALASMREQGLVETRRGRRGGTFVCGPAAVSIGRLRARLRDMSMIGLRDLGDEWSGIAGTTARLAAARSATDQVARLHGFADRLTAARDIGDRGRAHSRFFIELALASQSERLTRAEVRVQAEIGELLWIPTERALDPGDTRSTLHDIATAVEEEDAVLARDTAERHVQHLCRWLLDARLELIERGR
jgi:GntR family transcriptional regulator, transcriptional repressor for pyruvate dehydrogenase complex